MPACAYNYNKKILHVTTIQMRIQWTTKTMQFRSISFSFVFFQMVDATNDALELIWLDWNDVDSRCAVPNSAYDSIHVYLVFGRSDFLEFYSMISMTIKLPIKRCVVFSVWNVTTTDLIEFWRWLDDTQFQIKMMKISMCDLAFDSGNFFRVNGTGK